MILFLVASLIMVLLSSVLVIRKQVDLVQDQGEVLYQISGEKRIGQSFTPLHDNLNIIMLDLRNIQIRNEEKITFTLEEKETKEEVRRIEISGANIGDPSRIRFQFDPLSDSGGRSYIFFLESPTSTPQNGVEIFYSPQDVYPQGTMWLNNQELEGDLRFTVHYFPGQKAQVLREVISAFWERFGVDKFFISFYFLLLASLLIWGWLL